MQTTFSLTDAAATGAANGELRPRAAPPGVEVATPTRARTPQGPQHTAPYSAESAPAGGHVLRPNEQAQAARGNSNSDG